MFDHYGNKYIVDLKVFGASDYDNDFHTTKVEIYSTYKLETLHHSVRSSWNPPFAQSRRGAFQMIQNTRGAYSENGDTESDSYNSEINVSLNNQGGNYHRGEPIIQEMKRTLQFAFGWGSRRNSVFWATPNEFKMAIVLPDCGNMAIMIEKGKTYYKLMNQRIKKKNLLFAISRYLYRSCFDKDGVSLLTYLMKMMVLPENVSYVLENRIPFWFFDMETRQKVHCRLNAELIGTSEIAIEVSDSIWGTLSVEDVDTMVNYFYHNHTRSKTWRNASPKKLWTMTMGDKPSSAQLDLMKEFLIQNRTKDLIENRAKVLMASLEVKYPDRIKIIQVPESGLTIMFVSGKLGDWAITSRDNGRSSATQKVGVYFYDTISNVEQPSFKGPICIDNIHTNSSLGDQFASRALALLNDKTTVKLIYTIGRYIPPGCEEEDDTCRISTTTGIPLDELDELTMNWGALL